MIKLFFIILFSLTLAAADNPFGQRIDLGKIDYAFLNEISGMAASRLNKDVFWLHNDSGNENKIYAVDRNGKLVAILVLEGIEFVDTEDIALGPGPEAGVSYIYVADIGDNSAVRDKKFIYRFPEPHFLPSDTVFKVTISKFDVFTFEYPDGKRDAETIMIDPRDKDIVIVSKREKNVNVYTSPIPQAGSSTIQFEKIAVLPFGNEGFSNSGVTGGDISVDGSEIILKTYMKVYYYHRGSGRSLNEVFKDKPVELDYVPEPQGEAICFGTDNEGFYTTSERSPLDVVPHLYFYPRTVSSVDEGDLFERINDINAPDMNTVEIYTMAGIKLFGINSIKQLETGLYFIKYAIYDKFVLRKLFIIK